MGKVKVPARKLSAAQKISVANQNIGNRNVQKMQGTSRAVFHYIEITGQQEFRFFRDVNTANFPQTNITQNRLKVGETMALQRAYLAIMQTAPANPQEVISITPVTTGAFASGIISMQIGNETRVKEVPTSSWVSQFNRRSKFITHSVYHFDNYITFPPEVDFEAELRVPEYLPLADQYLGLVIEGLGSLLNLKANL